MAFPFRSGTCIFEMKKVYDALTASRTAIDTAVLLQTTMILSDHGKLLVAYVDLDRARHLGTPSSEVEDSLHYIPEPLPHLHPTSF